MHTGEKIKEMRKIRGWTQSKLAKESNVLETTIRKYELGLQNPKINNLTKIADALGVSILEFMAPAKHEVVKTGNPALDTALEGINVMAAVVTLREKVREEKYGEIEQSYNKLNSAGKQEANKRIYELTLIPEYTNPDKKDPLA